ncbi:LON peptidase substrate-binding domain-containing protein [Tistrella mobilis]
MIRAHDVLPPVLPIFPLGGVILLPGGRLPLNIFEPRYLAMIDDALGSHRLIGMVQPARAGLGTNLGLVSGTPEIYGVGCAGRISSFQESGDGRYLITLTGVARFRVAEELAVTTPYRQVRTDFTAFEADRGEPAPTGLDRALLTDRLKRYFSLQGLSADWQAIDQASDQALITSLAMICPFSEAEKQALLEAPSLPERAALILDMIEMALHTGEDDDDAPRH